MAGRRLRARILALTFTIGWLKHCKLKDYYRLRPGFNFHHRVVETLLQVWEICKIVALTFTIGWLKRRYIGR